jgi:hypothetical protein
MFKDVKLPAVVISIFVADKAAALEVAPAALPAGALPSAALDMVLAALPAGHWTGTSDVSPANILAAG